MVTVVVALPKKNDGFVIKIFQTLASAPSLTYKYHVRILQSGKLPPFSELRPPTTHLSYSALIL